VKQIAAWFLILALFVSACSGGTTEAAYTEVPTTATSATPNTTLAAPTTTAQAATTAVPTTTAQATTTTPAVTTTAQATTTTPAVTSTAQTSTTTQTTNAPIGATTIAGLPDGVVAGCGWFESQQQAQEWFEANRDFGEGVDTNRDGSACNFGDFGGLNNHCTTPALGHQDCATIGAEPAVTPTTIVPTTTAAPTTTATPTTTIPTAGATAVPGVLDRVVASCGWFESRQQAQEWFEANRDFGEGVDTNGDGSACNFGDFGGATDCGRKSQYFERVLPQFCPQQQPSPEPITVAIVDGKAATLTTYPLPTGQPVGLETLAAPDESDEDLCRIQQLPGSRTGGYASTGFPVAFDNLQPDQNVRVATIPVDWDDHEGDPADLPTKHEQVQIFMDYYETASQGAMTFTPTFADRWYRLPESVSDYPQRQVSDFNPKLAQHSIDAADDDLDFSQIDIVVFIFPNDAPIIAGVPPSPLEFATLQHFSAYSPGDERMIFSDEGWVRNYMGGGMYFEHPLRPVWSYYFHEAAHMFDLPDWYMHEANAILGSQQVFDFDYAIGPLNVWGVMSSQDGPSRTFVAWARWMLGWLDDDQVDCYTIEQIQQHGSFDTELVALDIYEHGTKAIIIRTGEYSGFLIESRRPVFPDHDISNWEAVGRDPYGLIIYEIDTTMPDGMGTLSVVTPDGHDFKYIWRHGRAQQDVVDALFNVGNTATVQGLKIELLFTGDRDWVRISN